MRNDIGRLIVETANAIGANPVDLATAISYETGGTFDPTKKGPTTQWGQHRGLIQFGEPQARQFGVDWNDPIGSQLGPNGAVAKYLKASGFKPGMSGLDLYSTINAGAPGKYGASDANNGGAPGDVRDKWANQMGGHRAKAHALLGGGGSSAHLGGKLGGDSMVARDFDPQIAAQTNTPVFGSLSGYGGNMASGDTGGGGIDPIAAQLAAGPTEKKKGNVLGNIGAALDASIPSAPSPGGGGGGFGNAGGILATIMQNPQALAQALMKRRMV